MSSSADAEATVAEFGSRFLDRAFADATDLLADGGGDAVVDAFPDAFTEESTTAEDALEAYWWGLYGQYGDPEGVEVRDAEDVETDSDGEAANALALEFAFADGTETATVELDDGGVAGFAFDPSYETPSYVDEDAFVERETTVDAGDVELDGRLTLPADADSGDAPDEAVPGVVLVHGQGVSDLDGSVGASKLLRDLAWGLASEGIAVLRYEKRLADHDVPDEAFTLDAVVVDDAVAAVDALAAVEVVDADATFVVGHSLGGMAAPRIAARHGCFAGAANLDGRPTGTLDPADADIIRYEFERDGDLDAEQEAQLEEDRETIRRIDAGEFDDDETIWGRPGVWHASMNALDPTAEASDLDVPVFVATAFGADEDTQPHLAEFHRKNHQRWSDADLPAGSEIGQYDGLDHYLQEGYAPRTPLSVDLGGNVAERLVVDLADWVRGVAVR